MQFLKKIGKKQEEMLITVELIKVKTLNAFQKEFKIEWVRGP